MNDLLKKAYAFDGTVRIYGVRTTLLTEEARQIHDTWPVATAALGRVLTTAITMGAMYEGNQTLTIQIDGGGPLGKILVTTDAHGHVRGTIEHPHVQLSNNDGSPAVGQAVGHQGYIHVTKDLKIRDVFTSSAELQTGEIAQDFTYYFAKSEQIPSSVGLGVTIDVDGSVKSAGGFILQVMPGASEETLDTIEQNINAMPPVNEMIENGASPDDIIKAITKGDHEFLEELPLYYQCDCSKEKFLSSLSTLSKDELNSLADSNEPIETQCQFCKKKYTFTNEEINHIAEKKQ